MFKERVLKIVSKIPKGKVSTYKEIAKKIGKPKAFRAVGNILNKNYDINKSIPCHRVVKSDGRIGGYAAGTKKKKLLLQKEGVKICPERSRRIKNNKIDLSKYLWKI